MHCKTQLERAQRAANHCKQRLLWGRECYEVHNYKHRYPQQRHGNHKHDVLYNRIMNGQLRHS